MATYKSYPGSLLDQWIQEPKKDRRYSISVEEMERALEAHPEANRFRMKKILKKGVVDRVSMSYTRPGVLLRDGYKGISLVLRRGIARILKTKVPEGDLTGFTIQGSPEAPPEHPGEMV